MLNISPQSIKHKVNVNEYHSFQQAENEIKITTVGRVFVYFFIIVVIILFLPWTQNVQGDGILTTVNPSHRPQTIHSVISGRIDEWLVMEGEFVNRGDTILKIIEIQDAFFDPALLDRTNIQLDARRGTLLAYEDRIGALRDQINSLQTILKVRTEQLENRIKQAELRVISDSIQREAALVDYQIAEYQAERIEKLLTDGLKSLTETEGRRLRLQETRARYIDAENRYLISQNELLNTKVELTAVQFEFNEKIASTNATLFAAITNKFDTEADLQRMENIYVNIEMRTQYRYITAPQNGYITRALKTGVGENIKEGEPLLSIMPSDYELAVEMYVRPIDLPLLRRGNHVRFIFDGWPAFVFSGWPQISFGTFGGSIIAIDNFADNNNLFRILVGPDPEDRDWPELLRVGSGAKGFALLNDVPVWFEIWRQLNGFPPNFYENVEKPNYPVKTKEPLRKVK